MKIANAKTFGNNPYATTSDVASAIGSHLTNVGHMPSGGTAGNYLRKTKDGTEWADAEIPNLSATIEEWGYTKITSENVSAIASNVVETSVAGFETVTIKQSSDDAGLSYTANAGNRTFTFVAGDNVTFTNGDNQVTINAVGGTPGGATSAGVSSIASSIASSMIDARLTSVYTYKGSVENYSSLPNSDQKVGDTYNVRNADDEHGIKAGDNVAWNGTGWDDLSGQVDLTSYALKEDAATDHNHDGQYLKLSGGTVTGTVYATVMSAVDSMSEGGVKLSDKYAAKSHAHEMVDVNGLQDALDSKSDEGHTHVVPDVTGLQNALDAKAAASHSHAVSDVTGLQNVLDGKAALSHTHGMSDVTGLQTALDGKAASSHTHAVSDVTGLQDSLDAKAELSHSHAMSDVTGLQDALDAKADADAIPSSCVTYAETLPTASESAPGCVIVTGATSEEQTKGHVYSLLRHEQSITKDLNVSFNSSVFTSGVFRVYGSGRTNDNGGRPCEYDLAWISSKAASGTNVGEVILFKRKGSDTRWYLSDYTAGYLWTCWDDRCLDISDPIGLSGMTFENPESGMTIMTITDAGTVSPTIDFTCRGETTNLYRIEDFNGKPQWRGKVTQGGMAVVHLRWLTDDMTPGRWRLGNDRDVNPTGVYINSTADSPLDESGKEWTVWENDSGVIGNFPVTIVEKPLPSEVSILYEDITAQNTEGNQSAYQTIAVKSDALATAVDVVANSTAATITFVGGDNIRLVGDNTNKTVTFSAANTTYDVATTTSDGLMGSEMVTKLNGIASGAEVNQFAFKTVKVVSGNGASTNVVADAKEDTLTLVAGSGVTLTANETGDSITIGGTATGGTTITAAGSDVTSIVASHGASISNTNGTLAIDVPVDGAVTENSTNPVAGSGVFSHVSSEMTKVNSSISSSISAVKTLIEAKASVDDLSQVAFTGNYNDLLNKPSTLTSTPPSQMIDFTSNSTSSVAWNNEKTEATFTHTLNCIPNIAVYDSNWELTNVTIQLGSTPNNSTFRMVLDTPVVSNNAWHCIMTYGHHLGTEVVGPEPEPEPTGKYAVYGLKRDVATLLVDNLSESDLSAYVYNTDGMGIVVLPEGYNAIGGNLSGKQFAIKNDDRLYVRTTGSDDNSWSLLKWLPEDTTMLAGHAFVSSAWITPIAVSMLHQDGNGDYQAYSVNFTDHALNGAVPKIKCLTGGGITSSGEHSDVHFPLCIVEHDTGNRRLVVLTYNGRSAANRYSYCDLVDHGASNSNAFYPHTPTKTDYVACTGPGGYHSDDWNPVYGISETDTSAYPFSFGAAISASGGVDVVGKSNMSVVLIEFFYSLDSDVVYKHVSGNYFAPNGVEGTVNGSIYVATDTEVRYIQLSGGRIHWHSSDPSADMYTVPVTGLPTNCTVVKLVGGTGTTDPSVPEGNTDNIVIVKKN